MHADALESCSFITSVRVQHRHQPLGKDREEGLGTTGNCTRGSVPRRQPRGADTVLRKFYMRHNVELLRYGVTGGCKGCEVAQI